MPSIPAQCKNCGLVFDSGIFLGGNASARFINSTTTCPNCTMPVAIQDGEYQATGNVLRLIRSLNPNKDEIRRLQQIIRDAEKTRADAVEIASIIEKEIPKLSPVGNVLIEAFKKDPAGWLSFLAAVLFFLAQYSYPAKPYQEPPKPVANISGQFIRKSTKTGANAPCPCGSGRKYKRCCQSNARR